MTLKLLIFPGNPEFCCRRPDCNCAGLPIDMPDTHHCTREEFLEENKDDEDVVAKVAALKSGEQCWFGGGAAPLVWVIADPDPLVPEPCPKLEPANV